MSEYLARAAEVDFVFRLSVMLAFMGVGVILGRVVGGPRFSARRFITAYLVINAVYAIIAAVVTGRS